MIPKELGSPLHTGKDKILPPDTRSPREIFASGEKVIRLETVHLDDVIFLPEDEDIIDPVRLLNVKQGIEAIGMHTYPLYRPHFQDGKMIFDIADGFHRTFDAKEKLQKARAEGRTDAPETIQATIYYNLSNEELADQRVLATPHNSLQLPRLVTFINDSFTESFADTLVRRDIKAADAFAFAATGRLPSHILLSESEQETVAEWTDAKSKLWRREKKEIADTLKLVEHTDPLLVRRVRKERADADASARLVHLPSLLAIATVYFGKDYYHVQQQLVKAVKEYKLDEKQTKIMVRNLRKLGAQINSKTPAQEVLQLARNEAQSIQQDKTVTAAPDRKAKPGRKPRTKSKETPDQGLSYLLQIERRKVAGLTQAVRDRDHVIRQQQTRIRILEEKLANPPKVTQGKDVFIANTDAGVEATEIHWDTVSYTADEGSREWFNSPPINKQKVTKMIDDAAQSLFPDLQEHWPDVLTSVQLIGRSDAPLRVGLDALFLEGTGDYGVTKRMAAIASVGWDRTSPEFAYLSGLHYTLSIQARMDATTEPVELGKLQEYHKLAKTALKDHVAQHFTGKYSEALGYLLYSGEKDPGRNIILTDVFEYQTNEHSGAVVERFLKEQGQIGYTIEDLFQFRVLGRKVRRSER